MDPKADAVITTILNAIEKPTSFDYPDNEGKRKDTLIDRAVLSVDLDATEVPYWHTVDLIASGGMPGLRRIRFGYYRKKKVLRWGAQQALTATEEEWKKLLVHAAKEKPWFRKLLDDVMAELAG